MPLPTSRNIQIRNAVRTGLWKEPVIQFIEEEDITEVSPGRLRALIGRGVVSAGRAEELLDPFVELTSVQKARLAKAVRAGDYITGLSTSYTLRNRSYSGDTPNAYVASPSIPGPHILADVYVTGGSEASSPAPEYYELGLFHAPTKLASAAELATGTPVFRGISSPGASVAFGDNFLFYTVNDNSPFYSLHPDLYVDRDSTIYTFACYGEGQNNSEVQLTLVTREMAPVDRESRKPKVETVIRTITRRAPASSRTASRRLGGASVKTVKAAASYRVILSDRQFTVDRARLSTIFRQFTPLAVVPENEGDAKWSQLKAQGRLSAFVS